MVTLGERRLALGEAVDGLLEFVSGGLTGVVVRHGGEGRSDEFDTNQEWKR